MEIKDVAVISIMGLGIITLFVTLIVGGAMTMSVVAGLIHLAY